MIYLKSTAIRPFSIREYPITNTNESKPEKLQKTSFRFLKNQEKNRNALFSTLRPVYD
jgi:hypothetical protein